MIRIALVVLGLTSYVLPAMARGESARQRQERACEGDAMKFCRQFVPDEGKITACMGQHHDQLSDACRILFDNGGK